MPDVDAFVALIRSLDRGPCESLRGFFSAEEPITVARAPGRLDVMGGIADYSGALVLQLPIREATFAAAQPAGDGMLRVASLPVDDATPFRTAQMTPAQFARLCEGDYAAARDWFAQDPETAWAAYVAGVVLVLAKECGASCEGGLRLLVHSRVPEAKGVSSSAALEVATLQASRAILGVEVDGAEAARLGQLAENLVVGAPCGIMDQMTSAVGRADQLLALLCQPAEVQGFVPLPSPVRVWGIDSGIRHAVSGSDYTSVRTGAFMGYRILADLAGIPVEKTGQEAVLKTTNDRWQGYLANLGPQVFEESFVRELPETMEGGEFLRRYGGTTDRVTRVDPQRTYAIRQPTAHPVYEHARVGRFAELLGKAHEDRVLETMGELMYASHASYSACGLGSDGTDHLVALVREAGPAAGLFGAKITGGGSGGTVAVLGRADAGSAVDEIAARYCRESGYDKYVFSGSSPGAWEFGVRTV